MLVKNKSGFTLIELLVVVLIIGILSAIALPQYQRAVNKARFTEVQTNMSALIKSAQAYLLANDYPSSGTTVYLTGSTGVGDIGVSGTESATGVTTKLGTYYAFCQSGICMIQFGDWIDKKWFNGFIYISMYQSQAWSIYISSSDEHNKKMACDWWNNGGFGATCS